jgi:hypothetical protein
VAIAPLRYNNNGIGGGFEKSEPPPVLFAKSAAREVAAMLCDLYLRIIYESLLLKKGLFSRGIIAVFGMYYMM